MRHFFHNYLTFVVFFHIIDLLNSWLGQQELFPVLTLFTRLRSIYNFLCQQDQPVMNNCPHEQLGFVFLRKNLTTDTDLEGYDAEK
jgi:hypothetical protein